MAGRFNVFRGRRYLFARRMQQAAGSPGTIRISARGAGWDRAYARITAIPPNVRTMISSALRDNAEMIAARAREYVRHGGELNTNNLHDCIQVVWAWD